MLKRELDISKIVFVGMPLLSILWGVAFIILLIISRDMKISKYGSILILLLSIPIYVILVTKYASKLGATIDTTKQTENSETNYFRCHVKIFDLFFVGTSVIAIPLYFIIEQFIFNINEKRFQSYLKWVILIFICFGSFLRAMFSKRTKCERTRRYSLSRTMWRAPAGLSVTLIK